MSIASSFTAVISKNEELQKVTTAVTKAVKVIQQLEKIVKEAGYASVEDFYASVQAIEKGQLPSTGGATKGKKRGPKPGKTAADGGEKKPRGKRPTYTQADRDFWKSVYTGAANYNLSETLRILKQEGKPVSYPTLSNESKKWPKKAE